MPLDDDSQPHHRKPRELIANFLWLSSERVLDLITAIAVTVLMARYLGPARYGEIAFLAGVATLFTAIARAGIDQVVIRDLIHDTERKNLLLGTAIAIKFTAGLLAALLMMLSLAWSDDGGPQRLSFGGILAATLLIQALDVPDMLFSSRTQSRYPVMARSSARIVMAVIRLGLVLAAAPLIAFVSALTLETLLIVVMMLVVFYWQGNRLLALRFDKDLALSLVRRGFPLMISGIAILIMMRIDIIMLEHYRGAATVGIFAGATRIADMCSFISTGVMTSVTPTMIAIGLADRVRYDTFIARLYQGLALVMIVIAVFFTLFAGGFIHLLLGPSYAESANVLRIYIWSCVFISLGVVQGQWLVNEGYQLFMFYRAAGGAVLNILANLVLIPAYGAEGAAMATCIAQFASCILSNLCYDRATRHMFVLQAKALLGANLLILKPSR
jgi:O-antigen/teichoic acid export membrane protein